MSNNILLNLFDLSKAICVFKARGLDGKYLSTLFCSEGLVFCHKLCNSVLQFSLRFCDFGLVKVDKLLSFLDKLGLLLNHNILIVSFEFLDGLIMPPFLLKLLYFKLSGGASCTLVLDPQN